MYLNNKKILLEVLVQFISYYSWTIIHLIQTKDFLQGDLSSWTNFVNMYSVYWRILTLYIWMV